MPVTNMATPDICFLFNAFSNSGKSTSRELELRKQIDKRWRGAEFIKTEPDDDFWSELQNRLHGVKTIVACGGDGTVHRAGNLAVELYSTLGVVPIGSGNDFAYMMGIPTSLVHALNHLQTSGTRSIDLIKLTGDIQCYCLNTAGVGLDGLANHYTNIYKQNIGRAGYVAGALKAIFEIQKKAMSISIDGSKHKEELLMVTTCNGVREGGSFYVAPKSEPDDGLINLLMVKPMSRPALLRSLPLLLNAQSGSITNTERHLCSSVEIFCEQPVYIHVDGEYPNTQIRHVTFDVVPSALKVIA